MSLACLLMLAAFPAAAGEMEDAAARLAKLAAAAKPRFIVDKARGAWFRKVAGPLGAEFQALETSGILPEPVFDPAREHAAAPGEESYKSGPLDRPDVYLGLHAEGAEVDAGLIWDHVYGSDKLDTGKFAYRVYWRTSKGGWRNPAVGAADNLYLRPGEAFSLALRARADGSATLSVTGPDGSADYSFPVPGLLTAAGSLKPLSFKRVHSIDQFRLVDKRRDGNEGFAALPTRAELRGGRWESARLVKADGSRAVLSGPLATVVRGVDAADRYGAVFPATEVGADGEEDIVVLPPRP